MSVTTNKRKIVYEKVLVVKSIHNSKDSLKKVLKLQISQITYHLECVELKEAKGPCHLSPPGTPCWEFPATRKQILFLDKNISLIREYSMKEYT